jgi:arylsulfatase A-like enzyme
VPMSSEAGFRSTLVSLWFRLITLGIVGLVFALAIWLSGEKLRGWTFYLSTAAIVFEVLVRLVFAALTGISLGTLCTAALAPFLWHFDSSREHIAEWATKVAVVLVVFLDSRFALMTLIHVWRLARGPRFTTALLTAHLLAFAVALCIPRARRELATSLDGFLGEKMTRRTAIATVAGAAALVVTEFALSKTMPVVKAALPSQRPKSNFLLITFDALSAEDMLLYGYRLATTPNIDTFARKATVFTNFYSACTFTTPSVATILTGVYPSEHHVYQLKGQVLAENAGKTFPHAMRARGYATGAFVSNPWAYSGVENLGNDYDFFPEPTFRPGGLQHLWDATRPLHQNSGIGCRMDEYIDLSEWWSFLGRLPYNLEARFRAVASFEHGREALAKLPDGFFLWIHVLTPHSPYLPDAADRGRFLPDEQFRTFEFEEDDGNSGVRWYPHYAPDQQSQVDQRRLAYDEFLATADRAFGAFMSELENSGKLRDTTVIVSADHGESFGGGVYQHDSPYLTRPVIHIPLIIRTPGQQDGRKVAFTADQTALAPTILELAGLPKPEWMRSQSLVGWLNRNGQGAGEGLAFCQYLEKNRVFNPVRHGTIGVIDGQYQYVIYLDTQKGALRPLNEAQIWNLDRSAEFPGEAAALRAALHSRFPELVYFPVQNSAF